MRVKKEAGGKLVVCSERPAETEELGKVLGGILQPGDLFFLSGDLGSGKTLFVRGVTLGLESAETATSPTFALIHRYEGELPLYHLDLYRLSGPEDLAPLALEEIMEEEAAFMIEWGAPVKEIWAGPYMEVEFTRGEKEEERILSFHPKGERYQEINHSLWLALNKEHTTGM
ncbi:MAG TPA: tRNA (adenosine(37)-N6)-threonylcarbamoyltransferase complex ATPase subunit type 1 TsaE [Firmicutes bacterium]|uniref:tRNA threonylcarbamoyladenosine biosynthesis protein TsaE n=1 Tax=Capillibacterium thermochitinicola TaxID=2699427 RepID=A0A8J6LM42_9FIRM|nr:tRNA (adenosine(37)-N6)-threonylcarbamoyltransferase complex ATPase subunit type 1 TsaE [Capillibacterium thermochitinicola]HHW12806.1 tRNA (adenosine(37)-N6)-threonylcarbamoyltransferase complex ATPase subunit type 1 TsaE [Bacillota bacterium]